MTPITVEKVHVQLGEQGIHQLRLKVTARGDFPAHPVRGYVLKTPHTEVALPELQPGESKEISLSIKGFVDELPLRIFKPTGYVALERTIKLTEQQ